MDASLLMMPLVGFLPPTDERVRNTVEAIERELMEDGLVLRYRPQEKQCGWTCPDPKAFFCRAPSGWPIVCT